MSNFRVRILPVLGPIPAMVRSSVLLPFELSSTQLIRCISTSQFGNAAAAYVIQQLGGFKMETLPVKFVCFLFSSTCASVLIVSLRHDRHKIRTGAILHRQLGVCEQKLTGSKFVFLLRFLSLLPQLTLHCRSRIPFSEEDILYLFEGSSPPLLPMLPS